MRKASLHVFRVAIELTHIIANFTRFYILSTTLTSEHIPPPKNVVPMRALVRLSSSGMMPSGDVVHPAPTITQLLIALKLSAIRIDRRPSSYPVPFHDVYLVELQHDVREEDSTRGTHPATEPWILEVKAALDRVKDIGGEAGLLGVW